ncbi:MAG: CHAT domain-containing protein [Planctomycetota bacterium]
MRRYSFQVFRQDTDQPILRCLDADGRLIGQRPLARTDLAAFVREVEQGYQIANSDLPNLGRRLYEWLDGPTERWLASACENNAEGLALHIDVGAGLRHLPWELLCADGAFLCANPLRPFTPVRRVGSASRTVARANRPLRLLFMACSPEDVAPVLDFEREERMVLDATRRQSVELVVEESGSLDGLAERVVSYGADYFDVFHLTGHADLREDIRDGKPVVTPIFIMEDLFGRKQEATAEEIARAFQNRWPRLVFLSGCKTGEAPDRGALPSMCEALVAAGAPAVLGWALPVGDEAASLAAGGLYQHLAEGQRLDEAVARARQKLHEEESKNASAKKYWHLLRLYADATPLDELVTPLNTRRRAKLHVRAAQQEFLDAGSKSEVCPRALFVGRRRYLQRCLRVLCAKPGEAEYDERAAGFTPAVHGQRVGVLLYGMGGLGKSSLAARLCERMPGHKRLVCVGLLDEIAFLRVLGERLDDDAAIQTLNKPGLLLKARLRKLLEEHLDRAPALFVFDDLEHNLDDTSSGGKQLKPDALNVLTAVLGAVRETASDSRVLVTCWHKFPLPGPARLHPESLESLRGAELDKKVARLDQQLRASPGAMPKDPALQEQARTRRARAIELAAGNPRLLEWLYRVLGSPHVNHQAVLTALEQTTDEFREHVLLRALLAQQAPEGRRLLAMLSVCHLPVDGAAVEAIAGSADLLDPHLNRAAAVGLVEAGIEPGAADARRRYFVSRLLEPLLAGVLPERERTAACGRAARHLHQGWWVNADGATEERALEVHRLAVEAHEKDIAVEVGDTVATAWVNRSRYAEAEARCHMTLPLGEDYRILHTLARAQVVLGKTDEALRHYERALALCPLADAVASRQVVGSRAAIMHNLAALLAQQGEVSRALALLEESLKLYDQISDVRSRAVTMGQIADILQARGQLDEALRIRREEQLPVYERLGDVRERAVTMGKIADILAARGQLDEALRIRREEQLPVYERLGDVRAILVCQANLALGLLARGEAGDRAEAGRLLADARQAAERLQIPEAEQIREIQQQVGLSDE